MSEKIVLHSTTKLADLLAAYPWLKEALVEVNDKFKLLNTPMAKVMVHKATISEMSKRTGIDEALLLEKIKTLIASREA